MKHNHHSDERIDFGYGYPRREQQKKPNYPLRRTLAVIAITTSAIALGSNEGREALSDLAGKVKDIATYEAPIAPSVEELIKQQDIRAQERAHEEGKLQYLHDIESEGIE